MTAQNRCVDLPTLTRQLKGDPDAIALKALEKDRRRRYASPSELAADIGRYLRNEPVSAHPPSRAYRARKYIRRHRVGVGLASTVLLLLSASPSPRRSNCVPSAKNVIAPTALLAS